MSRPPEEAPWHACLVTRSCACQSGRVCRRVDVAWIHRLMCFSELRLRMATHSMRTSRVSTKVYLQHDDQRPCLSVVHRLAICRLCSDSASRSLRAGWLGSMPPDVQTTFGTGGNAR